MKSFWKKVVIKDDVLYLVLIGLAGVIGFLTALAVMPN